MHLVFTLIASKEEQESDKNGSKTENEIEMKKIGDKSWILSPITGFQIQKPFRKPSDSSPQGPATTSNNSLTKVSLRWKGNIKAGSIESRSKTIRQFLELHLSEFRVTCDRFTECKRSISTLSVDTWLTRVGKFCKRKTLTD